MKSRNTRLLVTLNAVLLTAVAVVAFAPSAAAQPRPRSQYMMVGGNAQGNSKGVLYITDTTTMEVVAVQWDDNKRELSGIGYRNIGADAASGTRAGGGR